MPAPHSALLLALVLSSSLAQASPKDELHEAFTRFLAAKSFRATVTDVKKGQLLSSMQFVAPDRYHIETGQGQMEQILIGDDAYTVMNGRRIKLPMPIQVGRIIGQYRNQDALSQMEQDLDVQALGSSDVNGVAAQLYSYTQTQPNRTAVKVWVGTESGLPIQLESQGSFMGVKSTTQIKYYDFNDSAIHIDAPE